MTESEKARLDEAARAGWLYFIAGNTQEEIARKLKVSRPTAQRLVSLALSERLITFRLDHPIAACMELAARLTEQFGLVHCDVVPTDPSSDSPVLGIAEAASAFLEQNLRSPLSRLIIALGTGRTLRAAVEQIPRIEVPAAQARLARRPHLHAGHGEFLRRARAALRPDAGAALSDAAAGRGSPRRNERDQLQQLEPVRRLLELAAGADLDLVGVGRHGRKRAAPSRRLHRRPPNFDEMRRRGAVGEITGWAFDGAGRLIEGGTNDRLTSVPRKVPAQAAGDRRRAGHQARFCRSTRR